VDTLWSRIQFSSCLLAYPMCCHGAMCASVEWANHAVTCHHVTDTVCVPVTYNCLLFFRPLGEVTGIPLKHVILLCNFKGSKIVPVIFIDLSSWAWSTFRVQSLYEKIYEHLLCLAYVKTSHFMVFESYSISYVTLTKMADFVLEPCARQKFEYGFIPLNVLMFMNYRLLKSKHYGKINWQFEQ
jgi:hypothetical protein